MLLSILLDSVCFPVYVSVCSGADGKVTLSWLSPWLSGFFETGILLSGSFVFSILREADVLATGRASSISCETLSVTTFSDRVPFPLSFQNSTYTSKGPSQLAFQLSLSSFGSVFQIISLNTHF